MTRGPDFIVIGAMKCGSSTVSAYFEDHPEVFMVPNLDPHFFSHDDVFARGADWYRDLFAAGALARLRGENSNSYTAHARFPEAAARMAAFDPSLKLVYIVRHPIERIVSAWIQMRRNNPVDTPLSLDEAVTAEPGRYLDQSCYWRQVERYLALFPREQLHVCFMEDMQRDQVAFFAALCRFLGVEPAMAIKRAHQNRSVGARVMSPAFTRLKRLPGVSTLSRSLPKPLRRRIRRSFAQRVEKRPTFSPAMHAQLLETLGPDSAALLDFCGKPADFWDLSHVHG